MYSDPLCGSASRDCTSRDCTSRDCTLFMHSNISCMTSLETLRHLFISCTRLLTKLCTVCTRLLTKAVYCLYEIVDKKLHNVCIRLLTKSDIMFVRDCWQKLCTVCMRLLTKAEYCLYEIVDKSSVMFVRDCWQKATQYLREVVDKNRMMFAGDCWQKPQSGLVVDLCFQNNSYYSENIAYCEIINGYRCLHQILTYRREENKIGW